MKTGSETKKQRDDSEDTMTDDCPECGMVKSDWPNPKGVKEEGEMYCCKGCAAGSGCTCEDSSIE